MCVDTVTNAVMKNAEESARLLAKLSLTEGPETALQHAIKQREEGLGRLTVQYGTGGANPNDDAELAFDLNSATNTTADVIRAAADAAAKAPLPPPSTHHRRPSPTKTPTDPPPFTRRVPRPPPGRPERRGEGLTRASSFGPRQAPRRQTMPERVRSTVNAGAADKSLMLRGADGSSMTSPRHRRNISAPRLRPGAGRHGSVSARVRGGDARTAEPEPDSSVFRSKTLDDNIHDGDAGSLHTRDSSVGAPPATTSPPQPRSTDANSQQKASIEQARQALDSDAAIWKGIAKVAPNASHQARVIERQHLALQQELAHTRNAIVGSKYGQIQDRGPDGGIRVQQRSAHATYSYLMRQRKAQEATLRRQEAFDRNFGSIR